MNTLNYKPTIGLEVHVQVKTVSKLFCGCSTEFGAEPNHNICAVCTGQPGVLPVMNKKAVEFTIRTGLALGCSISEHSVFARKQYFYPDLPKNYQVSQYELPLCIKGSVTLPSTGKRIGITRVHLEEDAGKLLHAIGARELEYSLVDLNRTGIGLMEIVSEPDITSADEAVEYLTTLKSILRYIDVSDCDMEKGTLRCDANISIAKPGDELGTKVEIKNMNSFKSLHTALLYEIVRQNETLSSGGKIIQETRLWDTDINETKSMRSKEFAHDYRYFPEPDLVPFKPSREWVTEIKTSLPELPLARKSRFVKEYGLNDYDAGVLTAEKALADYFEETVTSCVKLGLNNNDAAKPVTNWITTDLLGYLNTNKKDISLSPVTAVNLAGLIKLLTDGTISGKIAKTVFTEMCNTGGKPEDIVKSKGLVQISDESAILKLVIEAINENPKAVAEFKAGKERAVFAIVGAVMKKSQGKANPAVVNKLIKENI
ncbi:MAG: Asp-tRNA(Asn)/Glu-tRNA(Gln) amidotransferase subunit GatB [Elusimicrobiota bacterium]